MKSHEDYLQVIDGLRMVARREECSLFEVERLWDDKLRGARGSAANAAKFACKSEMMQILLEHSRALLRPSLSEDWAGKPAALVVSVPRKGRTD